MRSPQTKEISGVKYVVTPLATSAGLKMLTLLLRIVGPAVKDAKSFADTKALVLAGLGSLAERLEEADVQTIVRTLAAQTTVTLGKKQPALSEIFELHFSGDYLPMFQWLTFALEVNFGSFFRELMAKGAIDEAHADSVAGAE